MIGFKQQDYGWEGSKIINSILPMKDIVGPQHKL